MDSLREAVQMARRAILRAFGVKGPDAARWYRVEMTLDNGGIRWAAHAFGVPRAREGKWSVLEVQAIHVLPGYIACLPHHSLPRRVRWYPILTPEPNAGGAWVRCHGGILLTGTSLVLHG